MNDSNLVHEDHLHPEVILWVNFSEESKKEFLEKIKKYDEELAQDIKDYLSQFKVEDEVVPVNLPLDVDSEEEFDNFLYFLGELTNIVDLKAYSVITEVSLADEESEKEDSEDLYNFPLGQLVEIVDLKAYSVITEVSLADEESEKEDSEDLYNFSLGQLTEIIDLKAYSVITEVSLADEESEKEDSEDLYNFPAIFSEEKEGSCYLTVFDWDLKEMEEYSGKFEKNEKDIEGLRFPFFQS